MAVDTSNNIIVVGRSRIFGGGYTFDYATVKYSSAGVPLWTNRYSGNNGSTSEDDATGVAVDGGNNVIVTGYSQNPALNYDFVTIKYSSSGLPLWTNRYNGPQNNEDKAIAVAVDSSDNIIITGHSAGGPDILTYDFTTIKYSSAGEPLWTNHYNGPADSYDAASVIAVDRSNNVIVAGQSFANQTYPYNPDWGIIMYSSIGTPLWTNRYAQASDDNVWGTVVDGDNNVIVAGSCGSTYVTIKYSNVGMPLWTNRYDYGPYFVSDSSSPQQAITADRSNNIIVSAFSKTSAGYFATIKYSSAGVPLWTNRHDGVGNYQNAVRAVVCDKNNDIIVMRHSSDYSSGPFNTVTNNLVTIKYAYVGRPPELSNVILTNGVFQMCVKGYSLPGKLVIEASTNLLEWLPVFTNSTTTNLMFFTDTSNGSSRFYRAVLLP